MREDDEEGKICCLLASTWTKTVAWLQIATNGLLILLIFFQFVGAFAPSIVSQNEKSPDGDRLIALLVWLLSSVVGVVFGAILLKGVHEKRPHYLCTWMVFAIFCTAFNIIGSILATTTSDGGNQDNVVKIGRWVVDAIFYCLAIWVVGRYKRELENYSVVVQQV